MTKKQCSKMVNNSKYEDEPHLCANPATVERDGVWYCKTHDPELVKEREAKLNAKWDKRLAQITTQNIAWNQCLLINPDNPRAVAESIGDMYEALKFVASEDKMTEKMRGIVLRTLNKVEEKNNV